MADDWVFLCKLKGRELNHSPLRGMDCPGIHLGPILYALFVSPIFDLAKMIMLADDNYVLHWNKHISELLK